jgi:hypothetical protein
MPQFIVRAESHTKDGSSLGGEMIVVTSANVEQARQDGAAQLGLDPLRLVVEPLPPW